MNKQKIIHLILLMTLILTMVFVGTTAIKKNEGLLPRATMPATKTPDDWMALAKQTPTSITIDAHHNPFEESTTSLFNTKWLLHTSPSELHMAGLLHNKNQTWAIIANTQQDFLPISHHLDLSDHHYTVTKIDLSGASLVDDDSKEVLQLPFNTSENNTSIPCTHPDCFSMAVQNIPTAPLLNILGQFEHMNVVTQPTIQTETSLQLIDISWEEALDIILKSQGLASWDIDQTNFIGNADDIIKLEKQAADVDEVQSIATPLTTKIISLHYLSAENLLKNLGDNKSLLSKRGHLSADPNKNAILIQDLPERVNNLTDFVTQLDTPSKQIYIQAYVVSIDDRYEQELGSRLSFQHLDAVPDSGTTPSNPSATDLPALASDNIGMMIFKLAKNSLLSLELSALESEGHAEMIASPHLITANQETAMIEAGEEIPYQESSRNGGTVSNFKKAVLKLEVTPQITSDKNILLNIHVNQDEPTKKSVQGMPTIETRQINTQVSVASGQTIVLGGIYENSTGENNDRVPLLGRIPLIGWLFHHQQKSNNRRQLLVFVTPEIAKS